MPIEKDLLWQALRESVLSALKLAGKVFLAFVIGAIAFVGAALTVHIGGWVAWVLYLIVVSVLAFAVGRYNKLKDEREIKSKYFSK